MAKRKAGRKNARNGSFKFHQKLELKDGRLSVAPPESAPRKEPLKPFQICALLLLLSLVFAVYLHVLTSGFVYYDDQVYVNGNLHVQRGLTWENVKWAFCTPTAPYWHPVTWLSHMLDCELYGLKPWGHHLTNLLFHIANTFMVFLVLWRMTGAYWRSWLVAALFGLHPLHVESVAWVAERKDVLSTFFFLLTLLAYTRYTRKPVAGSQEQEILENRSTFSFLLSPVSKFYFLALFLFALGLMSKPMLVTLPCVLLLLDYWPLKRWVNHRAWLLVLEKLPFFLLAAAASVVTFIVQKATGTMATMVLLPVAARLENALVSYASYLGKLFFPVNLAVIYLYPHPLHWPLANVIFAGLLLLGISSFVFSLRRQQPWLLVGWLWFVGTLVPVIGLAQVGLQAMADRFTYVPSIGLFMLVSWGAWAFTRGWRHQAIVLSGAAAAVMVLCVGLVWRQVGYWSNTETLFRHAMAVTKNNYIAYANLGEYELQQGQTDEAIDLCQEAIRLMPEYSYPPVYDTLGAALCKAGRWTEGIQVLQLALSLNPGLSDAHGDLAEALAEHGEVGGAVNEYQAAIKLNPDYFDARNRLGVLLENTGRLDEAIRQFQAAIKTNPAYPAAHINLGLVLQSQGRLDQALDEFQQAVRLDPHSAKGHFGLGLVLKTKGRLDEAIGEFEEGLKLEPDVPQAHDELGVILGQKGRWDEAIGQFQEAIRLNPGYDEAKNNLNAALKLKTAPANP